MGFRLGLDGGGTKTECLLADETGTVLAQATAGPSNLLLVGEEVARESLREAIEQAFHLANAKPTNVDAVCAGLAGAGRAEVRERARSLLGELVAAKAIFVVTDTEIALEAAVGSGRGVVLIAGTGSMALGRDSHGHEARCGGWGPAVSDEGSATDIGRRAIRAVLDARDGRGPATALTARVLKALGTQRVAEIPLALESEPFRQLASLFPTVVAAANAGDRVATAILEQAAEALAELARAVVQTLGLDASPFPLAYAGGAFRGSTRLANAVKERLQKSLPHAQVTELTIPPAVGAIRLAERLLFEQARRGAP